MADHSGPSPVWMAAVERAWRTLWQGFISDALISIGLGLLVLLETGDITSPLFWTAVGLLVGKSFLMSAASYMARIKMPPKEEDVVAKG